MKKEREANLTHDEPNKKYFVEYSCWNKQKAITIIIISTTTNNKNIIHQINIKYNIYTDTYKIKHSKYRRSEATTTTNQQASLS